MDGAGVAGVSIGTTTLCFSTAHLIGDMARPFLIVAVITAAIPVFTVVVVRAFATPGGLKQAITVVCAQVHLADSIMAVPRAVSPHAASGASAVSAEEVSEAVASMAVASMAVAGPTEVGTTDAEFETRDSQAIRTRHYDDQPPELTFSNLRRVA